VNLPIEILSAFGAAKARRVVRVLRALGLAVLFWTVNTREEAAFAAPLAEIIVTDEVEFVLAAVHGTRAPR